MISRRDFLGQVACAFAVAGIASRIPRSAIVGLPLMTVRTEVTHLRHPFTPGEVIRFVVTAHNTGPTTMKVNEYQVMSIGRTSGFRDGDIVEFRL